MKTISLIILIMTLFQSLSAQFPANVKVITVAPNKITKITGDLAKGFEIQDLSWASRSSVACFPGTQNQKFTGNHLLYAFQIPPKSKVNIKLIPDDKNANFSLYGYQIGVTNYSVVPNLSSCVSCEADYKWDYPKRGKSQDHTRSIYFNSIKNSYNIVVGVAGADGLKEGTYSLEISLETAVDNSAKQKKVKIFSAKSVKGKTLAYQGNLNEGVKIYDLSWASKSSVACFPATQNSKFTGNHVLYVTEIPAHSEMNITVVPDDKSKNLSLYAYMIGVNNDAYVPNLNSCITCEADYKWDYPKRGKTQNHTRSVHLNAISRPYKVVIGVAGADGLTNASYKLIIETK